MFDEILEEDHEIIEDRLITASLMLGEFLDWYEENMPEEHGRPEIGDFRQYLESRHAAIVNYRTAS